MKRLEIVRAFSLWKTFYKRRFVSKKTQDVSQNISVSHLFSSLFMFTSFSKSCEMHYFWSHPLWAEPLKCSSMKGWACCICALYSRHSHPLAWTLQVSWVYWQLQIEGRRGELTAVLIMLRHGCWKWELEGVSRLNLLLFVAMLLTAETSSGGDFTCSLFVSLTLGVNIKCSEILYLLLGFLMCSFISPFALLLSHHSTHHCESQALRKECSGMLWREQE